MFLVVLDSESVLYLDLNLACFVASSTNNVILEIKYEMRWIFHTLHTLIGNEEDECRRIVQYANFNLRAESYVIWIGRKIDQLAN